MTTIEDHLEGYRRKQQTIVDRVQGIIARRHNGLYVYGATGIGKTWSIEGTLEESQRAGQRSYRKLEGRCTPPGLIELVRDCPDHILFIDDDPQLAKDQFAQQLLLHLCGDGKVDPDTGKNVRTVTNLKSKSRERFPFTGQVIITSNVRLGDMPVLKALKGRIRMYPFNPTDDELRAVLRNLADTIEVHNTDDHERREVCEFVIQECENSQQRIDLRMLKHGLSDYVQWKNGEAQTHWKSLIVSSLQDHFTDKKIVEKPPSREERKADERDQIANLIEDYESYGTKEDVLGAWMLVTEKRKSAFYERLGELPQELKTRYDALPDARSAAG